VRTELCDRLGIDVPIFAFSHCRDVVAAVSRAGGLGVLGAVAMTPEELATDLRCLDDDVDGVRGKPYGVDTVIPAKTLAHGSGVTKTDLEAMITPAHQKFVEELLSRHGVPPLPDNIASVESLLGWTMSAGLKHVDVALDHPIKLIANALGPPPPELIERAHAQGVVVAALCGSVRQALKQKAAGVDIIIASGYEAGGHTGEISTLVLVPQVVDAVGSLPVLAAGGIGDGRQIAAALALGAQGVWLGSLWLTTWESDLKVRLVDKLLTATSSDTVRSRCLSGKPARQLVTEYTKAWDDPKGPGTLPMPLQYMATAEATQRIYRHAESGGGVDLLGTPVGQVVGQMNDRQHVHQVIERLINDYLDAVDRLGSTLPT